jgi:hypothetical protein
MMTLGLWTAITGPNWFWLLVLPTLSAVSDLVILAICWVLPLFDPRTAATMKYQVGAMAVSSVLHC